MKYFNVMKQQEHIIHLKIMQDKDSCDENFSSFVVEYEKKYREVECYNLDLPTGVQVFFYLQVASLTPDLVVLPT